MVKRKGVSMVVDEGFFNAFEIERQREQKVLRGKFGNFFNLGQRDFSSMLSAKGFKFQVPKQRSLIKRSSVKRRTVKRRRVRR